VLKTGRQSNNWSCIPHQSAKKSGSDCSGWQVSISGHCDWNFIRSVVDEGEVKEPIHILQRVHTVSAVELHVKFKGVQHLIWEQITEDFLKRRCRQDFLLKDQSILLSSQFLTNHGTLVEGAIEYWPLVFRSLWFVAINFYDAFFFLSSHLSLEGSSLQVHIPYAKSCRIFLLLKFVCFRNMNHIYA